MLLSGVAAPSHRKQQCIHIQPFAPFFRQKRVFRDGTSVRQGKLPAGPISRGNDFYRSPGPPTVCQSHQIVNWGPEHRLCDPALVLPLHFPSLPVHDLECLRCHHTADIEVAPPLCPNFKAAIWGDCLPFNLGCWRIRQHLGISHLPFRRCCLCLLCCPKLCRTNHRRRHCQQDEKPYHLLFLHKKATPVLIIHSV